MFINKVLRRIRKASTTQWVVAGVFAIAMTGAIGLGHATKQKIQAASYSPDCTANAILTCGTHDQNDFINKVNSNNGGKNGDLKAVYDRFGLQGADYERFKREARPGMAYKNGTIVVDGRVVATDAWSIGRSKKAHSWNANGYWADTAQNVFRNNEVPVMVLFDANGAMEFAVMHACGNPTTGKPVNPAFDCRSLTKSAVPNEKDTYMFNVDAPATNGATVARVVYNFGDGTTETRNDLGAVKHKFTKPGNYTVSVSVTFNLPGGKTRTVEGVKCKTQVTVVAPFYACVQLLPAALNDKKTQFRFTVRTSQGNGATLKDVDFTLDGSNTTTGVTTKDAQGNIYKDYTFAEDGKSHKVVAKVNFNVAEGVQSKTCEANVTSTKAPVCEVPGKEMFPPNAPECQEECKPNIPKGDARCEEQHVLAASTTSVQSMPETGMGNILGLFAGVSAAGAAAHRVVTSRRHRRDS